MKELIHHLRILCEPTDQYFNEAQLQSDIESSIANYQSIDHVVSLVKTATRMSDLTNGIYLKIINLVK